VTVPEASPDDGMSGAAGRRDIRPAESGLRRTPGGPASPDDRYAIVVGIDRYPGFHDLHGACNDAEAFAGWLTERGCGDVPREHVAVHLGRGYESLADARPVKRDIDVALHRVVREIHRTGAPSRLYLFFAGHGIAAGFGTAAVLMADAEPGLSWNLSLGRYREWLQRCRDFSEVILLSDCCRTIALDVPEGMPPLDNCPTPHPRSQQVFVALAADVGESAFETTDGRGRFTVHVIEGLRGGAADPDGEVRSDTLATFLEAGLGAPAQRRQQIETSTLGPPLVLATVPLASVPTFEVTIDVPIGGPRQLDVKAYDGSLVASAVRPPGAWTVRLASGLYELVDPAAPSVLFKVERAPRPVEV
jgi:hypothetical protein